MMELDGKSAMITGASRGIGMQIAIELAKNGANLVINDLDKEELAKTGAMLAEKYKIKVTERVFDVSSKQDVDNFVNEKVEVDILVNNAGIVRDGLLFRISEEDWDSVLAVNLKSAFLLSRGLIRPMMKKRWGRIINISSIVGQIGNAGQTNYAASKGGLLAFTKSLAREVASRNITVNAVTPGFIETVMTEKLSDDIKNQLKASIPMGTLGTAEDIAKAVFFLSSEGAKYITGATLPVNGGMAMV